jgi:hypothetical protein
MRKAHEVRRRIHDLSTLLKRRQRTVRFAFHALENRGR